MKVQPGSSKKGEIEFRRRLAMQQVEGEEILPGEYSSSEIESILADRMRKAFEHLSALKREGKKLSPYIEIGAERCQRSLVMENDLACSGAALDISFDMLRSCEFYGEKFSKPRKPLRICADAYRLPFLSASVPFVFCYETLHHFPDPAPVVEEINRVLSPGGVFFFDEEPYRQILRLGVFKDKGHAHRPGEKDNLARKIFRHYLVREVPNELDFGIIENHEITIKEWEKALSCFEERELWLNSILGISVGKGFHGFSPRYLLASLNGGTIGGICRKAGRQEENAKSIEDVLACPDCAPAVEEELEQAEGGRSCPG